MKQALIALVIALVLGVVITPASGARALTPQQVKYWTAIAACETGGNWAMSGSTYEGGVGFAVTTYRWWARELGYLARYPHAYMAPRLVQMQIAQYGLERYNGYWGCAHQG